MPQQSRHAHAALWLGQRNGQHQPASDEPETEMLAWTCICVQKKKQVEQHVYPQGRQMITS